MDNYVFLCARFQMIVVFYDFFFFRFGAVFSWDTGTSVGEIMGMGKSINSVDFKPNRPYRCVTASEDYSLAFMEGPPFKFKLNLKVSK